MAFAVLFAVLAATLIGFSTLSSRALVLDAARKLADARLDLLAGETQAKFERIELAVQAVAADRRIGDPTALIADHRLLLGYFDELQDLDGIYARLSERRLLPCGVAGAQRRLGEDTRRARQCGLRDPLDRRGPGWVATVDLVVLRRRRQGDRGQPAGIASTIRGLAVVPQGAGDERRQLDVVLCVRHHPRGRPDHVDGGGKRARRGGRRRRHLDAARRDARPAEDLAPHKGGAIRRPRPAGRLLGHGGERFEDAPSSDGKRIGPTIRQDGDKILGMVFKAVQRDGSGASFGPAIANSNARYVIASKPVDVSTQQLHAVMGAPVEELMSEVTRHSRNAWAVSALIALMSFPVIYFVAQLIARPLNELSLEAKKLKSFNLDEPLTTRSRICEVQRLADAMRAAKAGLQTFGLYVPKELVRQVLASGAEPSLGGEERDLTIMFLDLDGFTSFAENSTPDEITQLLSDFFSLASQEIAAGGGCVDKFIGDGIMAIWNAPVLTPRPCDARLPMRPEHPDTPDASQCAATPERPSAAPGADRHSFGTGGDRQCRLGRPAGIYGDRRCGEHRGAARGAEQGIRHADPGERRGRPTGARPAHRDGEGAGGAQGPHGAGRGPRAAGRSCGRQRRSVHGGSGAGNKPGRGMIRDFLLLVAAILMLTPAGRDATAQAVPAEAQDRELIIGTKLAPPFALKDRDASGPASASSCGAIAVRLKLKYRFVEEPTVQGLIEKTAAKTYDASIAAITVTANRESVLDFSQPYYVTGLGIAVARGGPPM